MKITTLTLLAALLGGPGAGDETPVPEAPRAPVKVVATLPVYAALARAIGGTEVDVTYIADANEDSHFVRPKPSYALELRRADMFVTTGLDLELWVPALLDKAGKREAAVDVTFPSDKVAPVREKRTVFGRVSGLLPASVTMKLAKKSIQDYSADCGHDLSYRIDWK